MKSTVFFTLSLLATVASAFHIVAPGSIACCDPLTIQYDTTAGTSPFSLSFHDGTSDGKVLTAFQDVAGTSFTWSQVTFPVGTTVVITLSDSSGKGNCTPPITVCQGSSNNCPDNSTTDTTPFPATSTFSGLSPVPSPPALSSPPPPSGVPGSLSSLPGGVPGYLTSLPGGVGGSLSSRTAGSPQPSAVGGLTTNGGTVNAANFFAVAVISAIVNAILA